MAQGSRNVPVTPQGADKVGSLADTLTAGDCEMRAGARIVFHPNGTGRFDGTTMTNHTHSGDRWHQSFAVKDGGTVLFNLGNFDGPVMNDDGTLHPWFAEFNFDPALFNRINNVDWNGDC